MFYRIKKANSVDADDALIWFCAIYCLRHFADNSSLACYFEDFLRFFFLWLIQRCPGGSVD